MLFMHEHRRYKEKSTSRVCNGHVNIGSLCKYVLPSVRIHALFFFLHLVTFSFSKKFPALRLNIRPLLCVTLGLRRDQFDDTV